MPLPPRVRLAEVGPRDGLQLEQQYPDTGTKIEWINLLAVTGVDEVQVTGFVHPRAVPQLADAAEVAAGITRVPGVTYTALIANLRGLERAAAAGVDVVECTLSLSDSHGRANINATLAESLDRFGAICAEADRLGVDLRAGIATALGDHFEGFLPVRRLADTVATLAGEHGVTEVTLADTAGMADPQRTHDTVLAMRTQFPDVAFTVHLHDTRRMALANAHAAMQAGATRFDVSITGLGGCPFSPGATGNLATEDLVNMLDLMGVAHGVDHGRLRAAVERTAAIFGKVDSGVGRAGFSLDRPDWPWRTNPSSRS
jgi:hydroxymethylglutaryl-CoA lyase